MSDRSDTSSLNEDWERYSGISQEWVTKMERMEEEMKNMRIEMEKKDKEYALLLSKREGNDGEYVVSLKEEIEKLKSEIKIKEEKTKEEIRAIQEEMFKEMTELKSDDTKVSPHFTIDRTCDLPIDSFLGIYKVEENQPEQTVWDWEKAEYCPFKTIKIRKNPYRLKYELCWKCDNGKEIVNLFVPDKFNREGTRVWIEGYVLKFSWNGAKNVSCYELTEKGLISNGKHSFIRV